MVVHWTVRTRWELIQSKLVDIEASTDLNDLKMNAYCSIARSGLFRERKEEKIMEKVENILKKQLSFMIKKKRVKRLIKYFHIRHVAEFRFCKH